MSEPHIITFKELVKRKREQNEKDKELIEITDGVNKDGFKPKKKRKPVKCLRIEAYKGDWRTTNYASVDEIREILHNQIEIDKDNNVLHFNHIHLRKQFEHVLNEFELMKKVVKELLDKLD